MEIQCYSVSSGLCRNNLICQPYHLWEKYNLDGSNFFIYLQGGIKQYLPFFVSSEPHKLNLFLKYILSTKKTIAFLHNELPSLDLHSTEIINPAWKKKLGEEIFIDIWGDSLRSTHTCCINDRQCLILVCVKKCAKFLCSVFSEVFAQCFECDSSEGPLLHSLTGSSKLTWCWEDISCIFSKVVGLTLYPDRKDSQQNRGIELMRPQRQFITYGLITAPHIGKQQKPPSLHLVQHSSFEVYQFALKDKVDDFWKFLSAIKPNAVFVLHPQRTQKEATHVLYA